MQTGLRTRNLKFFKGLRDFEENNSVPLDQVYDCQNARFKYLVISSKLGYVALGDQLSGGTKFRGIYEYAYAAAGATTKRLLAIYNKIFRQFNAATNVWDTISTTWPNVADLETQGLEYNNVMYFINPMDTTGTSSTYTPAFLLGGTNASNLIGIWNTVTNGSFNITIDGTLRTLSSLNFAACVTMDDVARIIQTAIRTLTSSTETVEWVVDHFLFTSANTTSTSAMTVTSATGSGTDISGAGATPFLDAETGHGTVTAAVPSWPGIGKIADGTFSVVPNSPRGIALESWVERLWAIGDSSAPNGVLASRPSSAANPTYVEDWVTNVILELIGKGGRCTAIKVLNNELFIWKEDSIWYNTVDRVAAGTTSFIELSRTGGAINQKSTIVVENDVWFLTPSLELRSLGLERQLGNNPRTKELTSAIQRVMNILDPDQSNAVASYSKRIYKLSLRTAGSPTNNLTIIFDYDTGGFALDIGQSVDMATIWDNQLVYTEDSQAGQAYRDETGYTANGASFVFDFKTPFLDDGRPDLSKRARYIYVRGQQSYDQAITVRLYRDANYSAYSEYTIQSPRDRGISQGANVNDGQFGARQWGDAQFGGDGESSPDIPMYRISNDACGDWLISVDRRCNMFAIGVNAQVNGGKVIIEQLGLKVIDDNENYKRANQ